MIGSAIAWGIAVGASLVLGALAAAFLHLPERLAAMLTAFGGGILLAAVAFELIPEADLRAGRWPTALGLAVGVAVYMTADWWLSRDQETAAMRRSAHAAASGRAMTMPRNPEEARGEAIAAGLVVDGVPESIALGLTIAEGEIGVALLVGILVGNVVEAYGAAQPIVHARGSARFAVALLTAIGVALAVATVLGATALSKAPDDVVGFLEAVAAGAVLSVVTISVVPYAFAEVSRWVAAATVAGFVAGYLLS